MFGAPAFQLRAPAGEEAYLAVVSHLSQQPLPVGTVVNEVGRRWHPSLHLDLSDDGAEDVQLSRVYFHVQIEVFHLNTTKGNDMVKHPPCYQQMAGQPVRNYQYCCTRSRFWWITCSIRWRYIQTVEADREEKAEDLNQRLQTVEEPR